MQDLKFAVRSLRRSPEFALATVLTLALAAGMATAVFTVVNAVLLRPLPYRDAGRLAEIWGTDRTGNRGPVSFEDFDDWMRGSQTLESGAVYTSYYKPVLSGVGEPQRLPGLLVSYQYFEVMGARPLVGRFFEPAEDRDGRDNVVVLSYGLWRRQFAADPRVVGRAILLNARPHVVVGVAPPDLPLLPPSLAAEPAQIYRPVGEPFDSGARDGRHLETLVRLRPGVSAETAQADLNVRCRDMERAHPDADAHLGARIVGLRDDLTRNAHGGLLALQGAVLALVLIACANIANLLLAKSSARRRELAIRAALGAGAARIARLLLAECLVLGAAGGLGSLLLAWWGTGALTAVAARVLPDAGRLALDTRVLAFTLALSLGSALLFGLAPLLHLRRSGLEDALKHGLRSAGDRRHGLRGLLAAGQIAAALVLLVAAGLLGKSFLRLRAVNPGFAPQGVLAASLSLPQLRYPTEAAAVAFFDRTLAGLREIPGVRLASMVNVVPLSGDFDRTSFAIEGQVSGAGERESPDRYIVGPDYFAVMQIPLLEGRLFDARDDRSRPPVCVISETAARLWFGAAPAIGRKVRAGSASGGYDRSPFREVVGVVGDVAQYGLGLPATPQIYMPHAQFATRYLTLLVRTEGDPAAFATPLRKAVLAVDPEEPVYDVSPLEQIVGNTIAARRVGISLLAVFAFAALALATTGIYGVVSYSIARRTSEFGIRLALGATPRQIRRQAVRRSLPMIAGGLAAGSAVSLAASKLMAGFLFSVSAMDVSIFAVLPLFLGAVALLACYLPARRAGRVDPLVALRYE